MAEEEKGYAPTTDTGPKDSVRCAINGTHNTRLLYVTTLVGSNLWRIPVWVCVDVQCMIHRQATSTAHLVGERRC